MGFLDVLEGVLNLCDLLLYCCQVVGVIIQLHAVGSALLAMARLGVGVAKLLFLLFLLLVCSSLGRVAAALCVREFDFGDLCADPLGVGYDPVLWRLVWCVSTYMLGADNLLSVSLCILSGLYGQL